MNSTMDSMKRLGNDMRAGKIAVTLHQDHCGNGPLNMSAIAKAKEGSEVPIVHEGVRLVIMDGHHRRAAMMELAKDKQEALDWTRRPIQMYLTVRKDGEALSALEIAKNSKLLNGVSSAVKGCTNFMDIQQACLAYSMSFDMSYKVHFVDVRTRDIRKDMKSANFIDGASDTTYNRYIRFTKYCRRCPELLSFVQELNNRDPLPGSTSNVELSLRNLLDSTLDGADWDAMRFSVEGAWYALNRTSQPRERVAFSPTVFYSYAAEARRLLQEYHIAVSHRYNTVDAMLETNVNPLGGVPQTARRMTMMQFRLHVDPAQKSGAGKLNTERIPRVISKLRAIHFPDAVKTKAQKTKGLVGADVGKKPTVIDVDNDDGGAARVSRKRSVAKGYEPDALPTRRSKRQRTVPPVEEPVPTPPAPTVTRSVPAPPPARQRKSSSNTKKSGRRALVINPPAQTLETYNDEVPSTAPYGFAEQFQAAQHRAEPLFQPAHLREAVLPPSLRNGKRTPIPHGVSRTVPGVDGTAPVRAPVPFMESDPTPLLRMAHIPAGHLANTFLNKNEVQFLKDIAFLWGAYGALRECDMVEAVGPTLGMRHNSEVFDVVVRHFNSTLPMTFYKTRHVEVRDRGYTILEGFADPLNEQIIGSRNYPFPNCSDFQRTRMSDLFNAVFQTFNLHDALNPDETSNWHPIFNHATHLDDADRARNIARFSCSRNLTMQYMMQQDNVWMANCLSYLDVYIGTICCLLELRKLAEEDLHLPNTGGRFLFTGEDSPAQCGHNDFDHRSGRGPGFFIMATGRDPTGLWISEGSHKHVFLPDRKKRKLAGLMKMDRITIPPNSLFVGHGFVQHAGAEWTGTHSLRYHIYLNPRGYQLKDGVAFAYTRCFKRTDEQSSDDSDNSPPRNNPQEDVQEQEEEDLVEDKEPQHQGEEEEDLVDYDGLGEFALDTTLIPLD